MDKVISQEYQMQARVLMGQEKYSAALSFLEKAQENDRTDIEIYLSKGICYANLNELEKAQDEFQKALKIDRTSGLALFHLGNIYMLQGKKAQAIETYNNAIANGYDDSQIFFTLGLFYEEEGSDEAAMRNYVKAIHKDPLRPDARVRKIRMLIRHGDAQQALEAIDEMLLACPDVFEGYHLRFLLLLEAGKIDQAQETVEGAIQMFPQDVGFALDKATLLGAKGQYQEALEYLDQIEKTMDVDVGDQRNIAMQKAKMAAEQQDMPKTIESLERAKQVSLALGEQYLDCESTYMLMNCYLAEKQFEKAKENAELLQRQETPNQFSVTAWYYLPYILKNMGLQAQAEPLYQQALEKYRALSLENPGSMDFYVFRILCLRDMKQFDKALELCDFLLEVKGEEPEAHTVKAVVLTEMGCEEQAKEEQKKAQQLGGSFKNLLTAVQA